MFTSAILRLFYDMYCADQDTRPASTTDDQHAGFEKVFDKYLKMLQENPDIVKVMQEVLKKHYSLQGTDEVGYKYILDAFACVNGKPFLYFFTKQLRLYDEQYETVHGIINKLYHYNNYHRVHSDIVACIEDSKIQSLLREVAGYERVVSLPEDQSEAEVRECDELILSMKKHYLLHAVEQVMDARTQYIVEGGRTKRVLAGTGSAKRARLV